MANLVEASSLETSASFRGSSINPLNGMFHSLLPWKLGGASIQAMKAFMGVVVKAFIEYSIEYSIDWLSGSWNCSQCSL